MPLICFCRLEPLGEEIDQVEKVLSHSRATVAHCTQIVDFHAPALATGTITLPARHKRDGQVVLPKAISDPSYGWCELVITDWLMTFRETEATEKYCGP